MGWLKESHSRPQHGSGILFHWIKYNPWPKSETLFVWRSLRASQGDIWPIIMWRFKTSLWLKCYNWDDVISGSSRAALMVWGMQSGSNACPLNPNTISTAQSKQASFICFGTTPLGAQGTNLVPRIRHRSVHASQYTACQYSVTSPVSLFLIEF